MPLTQVQTQMLGTSVRFNEAFEYRDGDIYWAINPNNIIIGSLAGATYVNGYRRVKLDGKMYAVHRVVWVMFNGDIPDGLHIDHIDGNPKNNSIQNLRLVTHSQNCMNRKPKKTNTGVPNVSYSKHNNKYRVSVTAKNQTGFFGWFDDLELAELVAIEARDKFHNKYARIGA
jgi:uncharacterized protein YkuJ